MSRMQNREERWSWKIKKWSWKSHGKICCKICGNTAIAACGRPLKPLFHWKWGSCWVPNANEIYTKKMKCTWPTPVFCIGTQHNLYSTDWRQGLASAKTQILALGNAKIYQHVGISKAKFWRVGHCPTPTPDARYFASQWNIGLYFQGSNCKCFPAMLYSRWQFVFNRNNDHIITKEVLYERL